MTLAEFRRTKAYDLIAAAPLIGWYGLGVYGQLPNLLGETVTLQANAQNLRAVLHVLALATSFAFLGLLVVLLLLRRPAMQRSSGLAPRAIAFAHAFLTVGFVWIAPATPSLGINIVSWLLTACGAAGSFYVALWLGGSFSIMPEARALVTRGPYGRIRHPLYLAEAVGSLGVMLQYRQPWAGLLFLAALGLLVFRMRNEERVLMEAFPEYRDYAQRTARLIPGLY